MNERLLVYIAGELGAISAYTDAFRVEGHLVHAMGNIKEAVESFSCALPDLIILDRSLPGGDGIKLLQRIKELPGLRGVPVLMFDSKAGPADSAPALPGVDCYLAKPFNAPDLLFLAATLVKRRSAGAGAAPLSRADTVPARTQKEKISPKAAGLSVLLRCGFNESILGSFVKNRNGGSN